MASASALEQGSIIWITSTDPRGQNPKTRGFVVLTATAAIRLGEPLNRVAVTGTFREPLDKMMVPMRWNATGTTETGFTKKCFAKCDWGRVITTRKGDSGPEFDGIYEGKRVRKIELLKILERVEQHRKAGRG